MIERELEFEEAVVVADRLRGEPGFAFLDSADSANELGRFSFLATDPFGTFVVADGVAFWDRAPLDGPPLQRLRERLDTCRLDAGDGAWPFRGGAIGFVSYDFGRRLDPGAEPPSAPPGEEVLFRFFDVVLAFDNRDRRCRIFSSGLPEPPGPRRAARAERRLNETVARLRAAAPASGGESDAGARQETGPWSSNFKAASYGEAVEQVRELIRAGDIYQANIARRFEAALPPGFDHWRFYRSLRRANPAPFAAFLDLGERSIASSSPERFLSCRNGLVEARPIKGTTARSADPAADAALAAALLASEKDRAENVMIVDLLRNDLSRVCRPGTIAVPTLCGLESYAGVHHLVSTVSGRLRENRDCIDLLEAAFPGGSITGAPKLRAMGIIAAIEKTARGVYCGAIGWLGFDGDMDLNIAIRTVELDARRAIFQAGGGITLLSDPQAEYRETTTKAQRIFDAFGEPKRGADA